MLYCNRADTDREVRRVELRMTWNINSIRMQEEQAMKKIQKAASILLLFLLCGCGNAATQTGTTEQVTTEAVSADNAYADLADSLDTAVVEKVDQEGGYITFWNSTVQKSYTLSYDHATGIKSRHGEELVAGQLQSGDLVQVTFQKDTKKCKNIWLDDTAAVTEQVRNFSINHAAHTMEIGGEQYTLPDGCAVLSQGKVLTLMDINTVDTLRVTRVDHSIESIVITNGHGYVRLLGAEAFEGGWVEFGQSIIKKVEKDMLLVIPEGSYDMLISHGSNVGTKQVEVQANEEVQVDVSDLAQVEENKKGGIVFTISPSSAYLTIDGTDTDYSEVVYLPYGIHQMTCKAEGYKTITQYIKVGDEMANINIEMEAGSDDTDTSSVSSNTVTASSSGYQVYIDAPQGGELYVDGKYIGLIPTSFDKKSGSYTVSIRKSGYITRSYSLQVDDSEKDVHYSFSELESSTAAIDASAAAAEAALAGMQ